MKIKRTFIAKIAVGFREGYSKKVHTIDEAYEIAQEYCNRIGLCVTVTPTRFIYTQNIGTPDGFEDGCFVELISYPTSPTSKYDIAGQAIDLGKIFMRRFKQNRMSVITSDQTYLIEQRDIK